MHKAIIYPGVDLGFRKRGGGLTEGTNLLDGGKHAGTRGMPPRKSSKIDAKYCNLETIPLKMHISAGRYFIYCILPLDYRYGSQQHLLMEKFV